MSCSLGLTFVELLRPKGQGRSGKGQRARPSVKWESERAARVSTETGGAGGI